VALPTIRASGGRRFSETNMSAREDFTQWVASIDRGDCGYTYIRLYRDAPEWVKHMAVNRFGKGTVFLRAQAARPKAA